MEKGGGNVAQRVRDAVEACQNPELRSGSRDMFQVVGERGGNPQKQRGCTDKAGVLGEPQW